MICEQCKKEAIMGKYLFGAKWHCLDCCIEGDYAKKLRDRKQAA